jgi:peptidoglycan/LPS O-acetylase OafA/YrhL
MGAPINTTRNPGIDLLRGIAILLVVLLHLRLRIPVKAGFLYAILPDWLLSVLVDRGNEGVIIFFVISGFLITTHTLMRWGELHTIDARAFWARRAARILPLLILLVAMLSWLHLLEVDRYTIHRPNQSLTGAIVATFGFHVNWYEGQTGYLPASWDILWSLSIEEVFYLGFPITCLLVRNRIAMMILLTTFAFSLPLLKAHTGGSAIWQSKAYLPGMSAISMGVLTALLVSTLQRPSVRATKYICAIGAVGVVLALVLVDTAVLFPHSMLLLLTLSSACLLIGWHWGATHGSFKFGLPTAWLRSMGRLSYEIYLTHVFVVFAVADLFVILGWSRYWGFILYVPAIASAWLLAWLVERYISVPAMRTLLSRRPRKQIGSEALVKAA